MTALEALSYLTLQPCTGTPGQVWTHIPSTRQLRNGLGGCADPYFAISDTRPLFAAACGTHHLQRWTVTDVEVLHGP